MKFVHMHACIRGSPPPYQKKRRGGPADRRRRIVTALARCYVMETDRIVYDTRKIVPCRSTVPYLDPVSDPDSGSWPWIYTKKYQFCATPTKEVRRKEVLARIAAGNLGIEDKLGVWTGSFWRGLRLSGAIRNGPGTEIRVWEASHRELVADLSEMPLMHRLEPRAAKGGQRRLRRCYVVLMPPEDPMGPATLAGLFAGALLRDVDGESWMDLPDQDAVRSLLHDWGIPFLPLERPQGRRIVRVSPLFAALVAHLMPPHSARRIRAIRKAGGCPYLSVVLYEMVLAARNQRYMCPDALPFGYSKASSFRKGWRRKDLHKAGWVDLRIRITPKLRELMVEWRQRRTSERMCCSYDAATYPVPPEAGIPPLPFPPPVDWR